MKMLICPIIQENLMDKAHCGGNCKVYCNCNFQVLIRQLAETSSKLEGLDNVNSSKDK